MSFLGLGGGNKPSSAEKVAMWEQEILAVTNHQKSLNDVCQIKCVGNNFHEAELNKGEVVCLDRCAAKFFEAQKLVGQTMQQSQQQIQAQNDAAGSARGLF